MAVESAIVWEQWGALSPEPHRPEMLVWSCTASENLEKTPEGDQYWTFHKFSYCGYDLVLILL